MNKILKEIDQIADVVKLVQIMELSAYKCGADSVKGIADKESKSPQGIMKSNAYRKIKIGNALIVIPNLRHM